MPLYWKWHHLDTGADKLRFPEGFLWGVSTAAHQIEGDNVNNQWSRWENTKRCDRPSTVRLRRLKFVFCCLACGRILSFRRGGRRAALLWLLWAPHARVALSFVYRSLFVKLQAFYNDE